MSDDKGSLALRIFHQARIECQIAERLRVKLNEYSHSMRLLLDSLERYAPWQINNILLRTSDDTLHLVTSVAVKSPEPLDLRIDYVYCVCSMPFKNAEGTILLPREYESHHYLSNVQGQSEACGDSAVLDRKAQGNYRLSTSEDIKRILPKLTALRRRPAGKPRHER